MISPPDVQNVPDVWTLLEQAHSSLRLRQVGEALPQRNQIEWLRKLINDAISQRDRFVLVPKDLDERERILKIVREELHQYYVSVPLHGCLFIARGSRK